MKYFSIEMKCRVKSEVRTQNYSIHGHYSSEELAQVLDRFIDKFVLCGSEACKLPETDLEIIDNKNKSLRLSCRACPIITVIRDDHSLCKFILKNPKSLRVVNEDEEIVVRTPQKRDSFVWFVSTTEEAVQQRRRARFGVDKTKPTQEDMKMEMDKLRAYVATHPSQSDFVHRALLIQHQFGLNETALIRTLFQVLFDADILYQLVPHAKYLIPFVMNENDEMLVLILFENLCHIYVNLIEDSHNILSGFYDSKLVDEQSILSWSKRINKKLDATYCKKIRVVAKPFLNWLRTAKVEEENSTL